MMSYQTYQPYGAYSYQQGVSPYMPPRFDTPQAPLHGPVVTQTPAGVSVPPALQTGFLCRPVTSREEALAVQADYFSPGTLMPDLGHGVVYMKRFNSNTGASDMFEFALVQNASAEQVSAAETSTQEIFESINSQLSGLIERMDALSAKIDQPKIKQAPKRGSGEE